MFQGFSNAVGKVAGIVNVNVLVHVTLAMFCVIAVLNIVWFLMTRRINKKGYRVRSLVVNSLAWGFALFSVIVLTNGATIGNVKVVGLVLPAVFLVAVYLMEGIIRLLTNKRCPFYSTCSDKQAAAKPKEQQEIKQPEQDEPHFRILENKPAATKEPEPFAPNDDIVEVSLVPAKPVKAVSQNRKPNTTAKKPSAPDQKAVVTKKQATTTKPSVAVKQPPKAKPVAQVKPVNTPVIKNTAIKVRAAQVKSLTINEEDERLEREHKRIDVLGKTIERQRQHDIIVADHMVSQKEEGFSARTHEAMVEAKDEEERLEVLQKKFAALKENHVVDEQVEQTQKVFVAKSNTEVASHEQNSEIIEVNMKETDAEVKVVGQKAALQARAAATRARIAATKGKYDEDEVLNALAGLRGAMSAQRGEEII